MGRRGVVPVAARLVGCNIRSRRLLLTEKTLACSQCEQVMPVTWNSVVVITAPLVDTPPGYQYRNDDTPLGYSEQGRLA